LVVGIAALSNQIFVGRLCKDGKTWKEGKQDVTSDVLQSIIQYVEPGYEITVNAGGVPKYLIRVTEIPSQNAIGEARAENATSPHNQTL
jgi:hypothetical protein